MAPSTYPRGNTGEPNRPPGTINPWIAYGAIAAAIAICFGLPRLFPQQRPLMVARRTAAVSYVKQLGIAAFLYADDSDDHLPPAESWMDRTAKFVKNPLIYHAPGLQGDGLYGFAFRRSLSGVALGSVAKPETVALFFDSSDTRRNASGELELLPNPPRYGGKNVVCFADGHGRVIPSPGVAIK